MGSEVNHARPLRPICHGGFEMTRKGLFSSIGYAVVVATFAAATLTVMVPAVAEAGSAGKGLSAVPATRNDTDFSSARRSYHRRGRGTAAGAFAAMAGTGLAIAASRNRDAYDGCLLYTSDAADDLLCV